MKALKLTAILVLLGSLTLSMADTTVDAQITAIQNATTDEERVELVNEFKETLSTLSEEERAAAIDELRSTMQANSQALQMQTQTRQRSRIHQADEARALDDTQLMNENHSATMEMKGAPRENASSHGGFRGGR